MTRNPIIVDDISDMKTNICTYLYKLTQADTMMISGKKLYRISIDERQRRKNNSRVGKNNYKNRIR